jgi:hypothetical protein
VTLDGDGQNDPSDIPRVLARLRSRDLQAVSARRDERQESFALRVLPSRIANALIARLTRVPLHDCGCGLKAYRRDTVRSIHLPRGMNRFLPAILGVAPDQVGEVSTRDRRRLSGRSHYGIARTFAVLRDLPALPFLTGDRRRSEVRLALATALGAAVGALVLERSPLATAAFDVLAALFGLAWWNVRRFNRAQENGVYRLREGAIATPIGAAAAPTRTGADPETERSDAHRSGGNADAHGGKPRNGAIATPIGAAAAPTRTGADPETERSDAHRSGGPADTRGGKPETSEVA